tara:strand:+ start:3861 stop:4532 length:672 start_codon:yes stop_codon:yes gene_type:complete
MINTILIPYRDRKSDLKYFLNNSYPLLNKHLEGLKILIIEQVDGKPFNRGKTLNIGFMESESDYYFTHDVDINPTEETIKSIYKKDVLDHRIVGIYTSCCNTLGGIIKMKSSTFETINGFPNNFWGWGCEDKDLQNRAEFKKVNITKNILNNNPNKEKYFTIFDSGERDKKMPNHNFVYNIWKNVGLEEKERYIKDNGLSTLNYKIIKEELLMENVKKITVEI